MHSPIPRGFCLLHLVSKREREKRKQRGSLCGTRPRSSISPKPEPTRGASCGKCDFNLPEGAKWWLSIRLIHRSIMVVWSHSKPCPIACAAWVCVRLNVSISVRCVCDKIFSETGALHSLVVSWSWHQSSYKRINCLISYRRINRYSRHLPQPLTDLIRKLRNIR